jgi:heme exporter protein B
VAEQEQGGFTAFLLAPVDRSVLLIAKAAALFAFLVVLELVAVPAFILLLDPPVGSVPALIGLLALVDLGIATLGTLAAALAIKTRARDLIGPIVALPLLVPVTIAAARALAPLFAGAPASAIAVKWPLLLALYDLTFALIAYAVFDFLLED